VRTLVTGAFGAIGGRIAQGLRSRGHDVVIHGRTLPQDRAAWTEGYEARYCDLTTMDAAAARQVVAGCEAIIHLASLDEVEAAAAPEAALAVSGVATGVLLDACEVEGVKRFIFASTLYVYGQLRGVIEEGSALHAEHPYARAHLAGEAHCLRGRGRVRSIVARLANVYGAPPTESAARFSTAHAGFCRSALRDGEIVLRSSGEDLRDFVSVQDVAQAFDILLNAADPAQLFVVGSGVTRSVLSVAETVQAVCRSHLGLSIPIRRAEKTGAPAASFDLNVARLRALGYSPHNSMEQETIKFLEMLSNE